MSATADQALEPSAIRRPSAISRVYGFGSVFAKTLRDARWSVLGWVILIALFIPVSATAFVSEFDTALKRAALAGQMNALPVLIQGILGPATNIETLAGFLSWRVIGFLPVMAGLWAIVALAGTLAGEAAKGSMELIASTPVSRRRIAAQKALGFSLALVIAMAISGVITWAAINALAVMPGDETTIGAALAQYGWIAIMSLFAGAIAFAVSPLLSRSSAAGVGALVLIGGFVVNGYADLVPGFDLLRTFSPFHWTEGFRPLAGNWNDVAAIAGLAIGTVILFGVGVETFARRDIGATIRVRRGDRSFGPTGLAGPTSRSFADRLPLAAAWGIGLGLYGLVIALSADSFTKALDQVPGIADFIERLYPGVDFRSAGGILQLAFFSFGALLAALAAATVVAGWSSDERDRRLDVVLAAPLTRVGWALRSGVGALLAILAFAVLIGVLTAAGAIADGSDPVMPFLGSLVLGLYAAALAGIGLAVGGLISPGLAAPVVAAVGIGTYLLDFIGSFVGLPDVIVNLALTKHLGQPMVGSFDVPGLIACSALIIGGLLLSAVGYGRRDIGK